MSQPPGVPPSVRGYLAEVERHTGTSFRFTDDLAFLISCGSDPQRTSLYEEILFTARFIVNARRILERSGTAGDDTAKLSAEFSEKLGKLMEMIGTCAGEVQGKEEKRVWNVTTPGEMKNFFAFCGELAALHSYELDRRGPRPA